MLGLKSVLADEGRNLASTLLSNCSKAINATNKFTYSAPIDSQELRTASYYNGALGGNHPSRPIFGLDSTPKVVLKMLQELERREGQVRRSFPLRIGLMGVDSYTALGSQGVEEGQLRTGGALPSYLY
jgi:hypothetical protein